MNAESDFQNGFMRFDFSTAQVFDAEIPPNLDPRLQWMMARQQAGEVLQASSSTNRNEIGVIAKVTNAKAWQNLSEVRAPTIIGTLANSVIVTGRIPVRRIGAVRAQAFVQSLKASRDLHPQLDKTTLDTKAGGAALPSGNTTNGGEGVIVGIIDYGCDFVHENFLNSDGGSRVIALWDQDSAADGSSPLGYGKQFDNAMINSALRTDNPYAELGYDPSIYEDPNDPGTHGTHVMDIAAGNGRGTKRAGMAPQAGLIFVNITHRMDPVGTAAVGKTFGDSMQLLEAAHYIFEKAGDTPCVINISLGTNGGPHDGTTLVEQGLDSLLEKPNRAIVLAAGNSFDDGIHLAGAVHAGGTFDVRWKVTSRPVRDIEMEIWFAASDRFSMELIDATGTVRATVAPGQNKTLSIHNKVVFVANRLNDPNNGDNMINIFLANGIDPGTYTIRLHGAHVVNGNFHAWIERDNWNTSQFDAPKDGSCTIGTVSCGKSTIAVGSYDAHKPPELPLSWFSSAGPTRNGHEKPQVSAPGHEVVAALSGSGNKARSMSGTSMASPAVAGAVALMLAEAKNRRLNLNVVQIQDILKQTARPLLESDNWESGKWHPQLGFGRIDASAAVQAVINLAPVLPPDPVEAAQETLKKRKKPLPLSAKNRKPKQE